MKSILFAILLFFTVSSAANPIRLEVPEQCTPEVQMASFVLQYFDQGVSKEDFHKFIDKMSEHPDANAEVVIYTRELIELVYGYQPKEQQQFVDIYKVVIQRCLHEKQPSTPDITV